jgi:hypothetical protein
MNSRFFSRKPPSTYESLLPPTSRASNVRPRQGPGTLHLGMGADALDPQ